MNYYQDRELEFLRQSNALERVYSKRAMINSIEAWEYAKRYTDPKKKIDIMAIKRIHKLLMNDLNPKIAGKIRKCPVYVGNRTKSRECLKPEKILNELTMLCNILIIKADDTRLNKEKNDPVIKQWHVDFEGIHPFEDGNGRVGRIIMNIQRLRVELPLLTIREGKEQFEYYKWFRDLK